MLHLCLPDKINYNEEIYVIFDNNYPTTVFFKFKL
jgi:hypothetical protein